MSALLAFAEGDAVHVVSDAASTEDDGTVGIIATKIFPILDQPAVLVVVGQEPVASEFLKWHATRYEQASFDDLLVSAVQDFAEFEESVLAPIPDADSDYFAVIAGWSASRMRPEIHYLAGSGHRLPSGVLNNSNGFFVAGPHVPMPAELGSFLAKARSGADRPPFNAETHALPYFEAMRQHEGSGFSVVGGFLEEVSITQSGIMRRCVHRWPDKIGARINV